MTAPTFAVGDRVKYARAWLRSVGAYTGPIPFLRGEVKQLARCGPLQIVYVRWDGGAEDIAVASGNLARESDPELV